MAAVALRELSNIRHILAFNSARTLWGTSRCLQLSTEASGGPPTNNSMSSSTTLTDTSVSHRSQSESNRNSSNEKQYDNEIEKLILAASLPFVNKNGWTKAAIAEGAESLGYAGVVHGMFPRGEVELVDYFYLTSNEKLVEQLKQEAESRCDKEPKPNPDSIVKSAVETRLRMIVPYIEKWPEALVLLSMPHNVPTSLANLLTLVDDICYYAGDRSIDVRWYSRRIGLATIYKMTELYLLQDKSPDYRATWEFLHRRIEEAVQIQRVLEETGLTPKVALDTLAATFETARSILRINKYP